MIALGNDHGGYDLMLEVIRYLQQNNIEYKDFGTNSKEPVDYPVYAKLVVDSILSGECDKGILICSTGIGISIAANRHKGIRAAVCHDVFSAKATRAHNNANILAMGGLIIGSGAAFEVLTAFLNTPFSNEERHVRRVGMYS